MRGRRRQREQRSRAVSWCLVDCGGRWRTDMVTLRWDFWDGWCSYDRGSGTGEGNRSGCNKGGCNNGGINTGENGGVSGGSNIGGGSGQGATLEAATRAAALAEVAAFVETTTQDSTTEEAMGRELVWWRSWG